MTNQACETKTEVLCVGPDRRAELLPCGSAGKSDEDGSTGRNGCHAFKLRASLFICLLSVLFLAPPRRASAASGTGLTICNQTAAVFSVAVGYYSRGLRDTADTLTGPFVSRGWWTIKPRQCIVADNPFNARYMFWWGYSPRGDLWTSPGIVLPAMAEYHARWFCVPNTHGAGVPPSFTMEDENTATDSDGHRCYNAAPADSDGPNEWVLPRKVDTEVDATVQFTGQ